MRLFPWEDIEDIYFFEVNTKYILSSAMIFVWFDPLHPINNLSVKQGRVFLGWISTKLGKMCLAQGPQCSEAGEARTRGPSVLSQALYHWATALHSQVRWKKLAFFTSA